MDPTLILFAIEAGVRLGQKVYEVLVDANVERPLFLPLGDAPESIQRDRARKFFDLPENAALTAPGGPYEGVDDDEDIMVKAYHTILAISHQLGPVEVVTIDQSREIIAQLHAFEQFQEGFGSASPLQRLCGTLVAIGIDFFQINPQALGKNSPARRVVEGFLLALDPQEFERVDADLAGQMLLAGLQVFGDNTSLVSKDKRLRVLLGGMTKALVDDFKAAGSEGAKDRRKNLYDRISASLLRGAMAGFSDNATLFLPGDSKSEGLIRATLTQVLQGLQNQEDLFSNDSLEVIMKSALGAVSESADLITDQLILQKFIAGTLKTLSSTDGKEVFSEATCAAILKNGLDVLGANIGTLIDPENPQRLFLDETIASLAAGLGTTLGGGKLKEVFSSQQLIRLSQIVFHEVAQNPEGLLGDTQGDPGKTALAQIIGSVCKSLGDEPKRLITGEGALILLGSALRTASQNIDKLLDLSTEDPAGNLLFQILRELTKALTQTADPRRLLTRAMFTETAARLMVTASNNLEILAGGQVEVIGRLAVTLLTLAAGDLQFHVNGNTFPVVFDKLLRQVLLGQLNPADPAAVLAEAGKILTV
jgi:hypothetical protein